MPVLEEGVKRLRQYLNTLGKEGRSEGGKG
jgi:hypothetical protein